MQYEAKFSQKKDKFKMLNQVNLRLNATEKISYSQVTLRYFLKGGREGVKTKGGWARLGVDKKLPLLGAYPAMYYIPCTGNSTDSFHSKAYVN